MGFQSNINKTIGAIGVAAALADKVKQAPEENAPSLPSAEESITEKKEYEKPTIKKAAFQNRLRVGQNIAIQNIQPGVITSIIREKQIMNQTQREMFEKRKEMIRRNK